MIAPDFVMHYLSSIYDTRRLFYLYSLILHSLVSIVALNLIKHYFLYTHNNKRLFYSKKVYTLFKNLFIYGMITYLRDIMPQVPHSIKKIETLLNSNVLS